MKVKSIGDIKASGGRAFRNALGTLAIAVMLAVSCLPGRAAAIGDEVFLYGVGGAYYAAGYTVVDQHVYDPDEVQVGTVDSNGVIWDSQDNDIGYVEIGV